MAPRFDATKMQQVNNRRGPLQEINRDQHVGQHGSSIKKPAPSDDGAMGQCDTLLQELHAQLAKVSKLFVYIQNEILIF